MSIKLVMPSNHLILCRPLLLLPSIFPSIRVFSKESVLCIRWPKYWSFSFSISPSNEYSGLISFRMDWLDLLAVQGTLTITSLPKITISCPVSPSTHCRISVFAFTAKCSREVSVHSLHFLFSLLSWTGVAGLLVPPLTNMAHCQGHEPTLRCWIQYVVDLMKVNLHP